MRPSRCLASAVPVALALAAIGCGDAPEQQTVTVTAPTASTPAATVPPTDATQPVAPPAATATNPAEPTDPEPGGGEQAVRVPASFVVVAPGRLEPPTITVPPFLAVEISVRSDDGRAHRLVVGTTPRRTLDVKAGRRTAVRIPGLRAGQYPVTLDGRVAGALVVGGEVGP